MHARTLKYLSSLVFNQAHLITPESGEVIVGVLLKARTQKSEELKAELQAANGRADARGPNEFYMLPNGVGVIPVMGELVHRHNWLNAASGIASYDAISAMFISAMRDDSVKQILLNIDSPGGMVKGCFDLVDQIRAARDEKPIIAYTNGTMASAAYAIGSAASKVIASKAALVGSIGILYPHIDRSAFLKDEGIAVTYFKSGKDKDIGAEGRPLSDYDREKIQARVDDVANLFFTEVSKNRPDLSVEVIRNMEAGVFLAKDAEEMGLIDAVGSYQETLENLCEVPFGSWLTDDSPQPTAKQPAGGNDMTKDQQKALALKMGLSEDASLEDILAAEPPQAAPAQPDPPANEDDQMRKAMALKMGLSEDATMEEILAAEPNGAEIKDMRAELDKMKQDTLIKDALANGQISKADLAWFAPLSMETQQSILDKRPAGSVVPVAQSLPEADPKQDPTNPENALTAEQEEMNRLSGLSQEDFLKYNQGHTVRIGALPSENRPAA